MFGFRVEVGNIRNTMSRSKEWGSVINSGSYRNHQEVPYDPETALNGVRKWLLNGFPAAGGETPPFVQIRTNERKDISVCMDSQGLDGTLLMFKPRSKGPITAVTTAMVNGNGPFNPEKSQIVGIYVPGNGDMEKGLDADTLGRTVAWVLSENAVPIRSNNGSHIDMKVAVADPNQEKFWRLMDEGWVDFDEVPEVREMVESLMPVDVSGEWITPERMSEIIAERDERIYEFLYRCVKHLAEIKPTENLFSIMHPGQSRVENVLKTLNGGDFEFVMVNMACVMSLSDYEIMNRWIRERDGGVCQCCGREAVAPLTHHIISRGTAYAITWIKFLEDEKLREEVRKVVRNGRGEGALLPAWAVNELMTEETDEFISERIHDLTEDLPKSLWVLGEYLEEIKFVVNNPFNMATLCPDCHDMCHIDVGNGLSEELRAMFELWAMGRLWELRLSADEGELVNRQKKEKIMEMVVMAMKGQLSGTVTYRTIELSNELKRLWRTLAMGGYTYTGEDKPMQDKVYALTVEKVRREGRVAKLVLSKREKDASEYLKTRYG